MLQRLWRRPTELLYSLCWSECHFHLLLTLSIYSDFHQSKCGVFTKAIIKLVINFGNGKWQSLATQKKLKQHFKFMLITKIETYSIECRLTARRVEAAREDTAGRCHLGLNWDIRNHKTDTTTTTSVWTTAYTSLHTMKYNCLLSKVWANWTWDHLYRPRFIKWSSKLNPGILGYDENLTIMFLVTIVSAWWTLKKKFFFSIAGVLKAGCWRDRLPGWPGRSWKDSQIWKLHYGLWRRPRVLCLLDVFLY